MVQSNQRRYREQMMRSSKAASIDIFGTMRCDGLFVFYDRTNEYTIHRNCG